MVLIVVPLSPLKVKGIHRRAGGLFASYTLLSSCSSFLKISSIVLSVSAPVMLLLLLENHCWHWESSFIFLCFNFWWPKSVASLCLTFGVQRKPSICTRICDFFIAISMCPTDASQQSTESSALQKYPTSTTWQVLEDLWHDPCIQPKHDQRLPFVMGNMPQGNHVHPEQ